ncbi:collagen alpha-1(I) chain-like [Perognathus longimembris pacificus]|uniref:collagen alpha-1(I) chain-like n=1 Tax=Perognathus longimembris pacificus TaxID=214514 RepID=UPI002018AA19|nr:collagen alpha-1(I) chain-like [Perognathus longimembris pacificus]
MTLGYAPNCPVSTAPEAPEEEVLPAAPRPDSPLARPAAPRPDGPLARPAAPSDLPSPTSSVGSAGSLACSSLWEFQKVTATRVQLSGSSSSPSSMEAKVTPGADSSGSAEHLALDSQERGWPLSCGPHQDHAPPGATPGDKGQVAGQRAEARGAGSLCGSSGEAAVAEGPGLEGRFLQEGWPPLPAEAPSPGLGSELSEASSRIWDEDSEETPAEPGAGWVCGSPRPTAESPSLENRAEPDVAGSSPGPGGGQEASGTSRCLPSGSPMEKAKQATHEAQTPATRDSEPPPACPPGPAPGQGVGGHRAEATAPQAPLGHRQGFTGADGNLPTQRTPGQALPEPPVPTSLPAPPEGAPTIGSPGPGRGDRGTPLVLEKARPQGAGGVLTELLSPVDEELSYGSGDLPSSVHGDATRPRHLRAPAAAASPPPRREDADSATEGLSSLSQEAPDEAPTLVPQEAGLRLGASGQDGSLGGKRSGSAHSQPSEPMDWPVPPWRADTGSPPEGAPGPRAESPAALRAAGACGEGVTGPPAAKPPREPPPPALDLGLYAATALDGALGNLGRFQKGVQRFEGAEGQQGPGNLLDRRAAACPPWPAREEDEGGLGRRAEAQPGLQGSPGRAAGAGPASGPCTEVQGAEAAGVVDRVSSQLGRRVLRVSLAVLSGRNPQDRA